MEDNTKQILQDLNDNDFLHFEYHKNQLTLTGTFFYQDSTVLQRSINKIPLCFIISVPNIHYWPL